MTTTCWLPSGALLGTVTTSAVAVAPDATVAATPPIVTEAFNRLVPVMRTPKPRFCVVTLSEVTVGASGTAVKLLVTVPPSVVTLTEVLPTGAFSGTVTTNCVAEALFIVAVTPPTRTEIGLADGLALGFAKPEPLIVMSLPTTAGFPVMLEIAGAPTTVNGILADPPLATTESVLSNIAELNEAPAGTTTRALTAVAVNDGAGDATMPPIRNVVPVKLVPAMVTTSPALATFGVTEVIVGGWKTAKDGEVASPPRAVRVITPVIAPFGTFTVTAVSVMTVAGSFKFANLFELNFTAVVPVKSRPLIVNNEPNAPAETDSELITGLS